MVNADLEAALDGLGLAYNAGSGSVCGVFDKARWLRHEEEIGKLCQQLQNHKTTLNLILTVFQCSSTAQVRESVHRLCELVGSALASNSTLAQRISQLEGNSTAGYPDTERNGEASDVVHPWQVAEEPESSPDLPTQSFAFDADLQNSKVLSETSIDRFRWTLGNIRDELWLPKDRGFDILHYQSR